MQISRNSPCPCGSGKKFKICHMEKAALVEAPKKQKIDGPMLIVLMPTRGRVCLETVTSLSRLDGLPAVMRTVARKPIVEARNKLAAYALKAPETANVEPSEWFCLWVDDDAFWRRGTVMRAVGTLLSRPEIDVLSGWVCPRAPGAAPTATRADRTWPRFGVDCEQGDVVEVDRVGFHFVMHRLSVLKKFKEAPFVPNPNEGEDHAFCRRVKDMGMRIFAHTGLPVAHIGDDGKAYLPGEEACVVVDGELLKADQPTQREYGPGVDGSTSEVAGSK